MRARIMKLTGVVVERGYLQRRWHPPPDHAHHHLPSHLCRIPSTLMGIYLYTTPIRPLPPTIILPL